VHSVQHAQLLLLQHSVKQLSELHQFLPHSLDLIGEIAIVELHNKVVPYEGEIGKAIMVVNSRVSTVYRGYGLS